MSTPTELPACITRDNLTSPYFPSLSFARLIAVCTLSGIFMLTAFNRLNHTDLWGHLNFGRWMAEHQALPATDPFATAPAATPVLQAAWLSQLAGYEVQTHFGNEGLALGHALLVTLTAGIVMLAAVRRGAPALWAWAAGLAMFLLDLPIVGTIRPQLFGQLGLALVLLACAEMPRRTHPLLWLPVVAALWVNLHGSILMGIAVLGIYAASVSWTAWQEAGGDAAKLLRDRRLYVVWGALLLVLAAACLNPHGPQLLARVLLFNEHAALSSISEWRPLSPLSLTGGLMIVSVGLAALLARCSAKKWELYEIGLLLLFGLATLPAIRMLAWWAIVWPVVCIPHAAAAWRKRLADRAGEPAQAGDEPTAMRTVLAMGFVFMTLLVAPPTFAIVAGYGRGEGAITVTDTPIYVADEAVRRDLSGNIATPMDWSDFLVWKSGGRLKPLVHSHVHLTELDTWRDYEAVFRGDEVWLHLLRGHHMQYVLVQKKRYPDLLKAILMEDRSGQGGVRIIYQDQRCLLAEVLPAKPVAVKPAS
ncbi:MAG TPA: hypothetical protein VFB80_22015 [Pirellulaceae bacterium]|nr:hypothetical protein [Pirellulaceae bacterium]